MFLDESGGRGLRGQQVADQVRIGQWRTSTFIAAPWITGLTAPGVIDGRVDGDSFLAYVEQVLMPTLHPRDIVVADNLPAHHVAGVRGLIAATRDELWQLPAVGVQRGTATQGETCHDHREAKRVLMIRVRLLVATTAHRTRALLALNAFVTPVRVGLAGPLSSPRLGWMSERWLLEYRASHP